MDFKVLGPLSVRVFGDGLTAKSFPHSTGKHAHPHENTHVMAVWGRHRLKEWAPGGLLIRDEEIIGNGPDSLIEMPAENWHELIALKPGGFHACLFLHFDANGVVHPEYFGRKAATI